MKKSAARARCHMGSRPKTNDQYFEQMAKTVFRSGFNWEVVEKKWPDIKKSFANFSVTKVARFDNGDINNLMKDKGVIRNYRKIVAVIENARKINGIGKEYGSFRNYLKKASADGERGLCKAVVKKFHYIGDSMVISFLRSVGEAMPETSKGWKSKHMTGP